MSKFLSLLRRFILLRKMRFHIQIMKLRLFTAHHVIYQKFIMICLLINKTQKIRLNNFYVH